MSVPFDFEPGFPEILVEWNAPTNFSNSLPRFDEPLKLLCARKSSSSESLVSAILAVQCEKNEVVVKLSVFFDNVQIPELFSQS